MAEDHREQDSPLSPLLDRETGSPTPPASDHRLRRFDIVLGVGQLILLVGQFLLAFFGIRILKAQNTLIEAQSNVAETQAIVSIVTGLDLEKSEGNRIKIAQLPNYRRRGHEALLSLAKGDPTADSRIRLIVFDTLFSQGSVHGPREVEETLEAWLRRVDPLAGLYAIGFDLKETHEFQKYAQSSSGYFEALRWRFTQDEPFRREVRRRLLRSRYLGPGLAVLHHAFLKYRDELEKEYRTENPQSGDFLPAVDWHISLFDFARALRGDFRRDVEISYDTRDWYRLANFVTDDEICSQAKLRTEIARWFPSGEEHPKNPIGAFVSSPTISPPAPTITCFRPGTP